MKRKASRPKDQMKPVILEILTDSELRKFKCRAYQVASIRKRIERDSPIRGVLVTEIKREERE
ncbi:hypothetical protein HW45_02750 [Vibrio sp. ER1A]|nr:hypothetical protein HW45_02750 [Vibrio sp. ER1A]